MTVPPEQSASGNAPINGVGLSNPQISQGRRHMLDLVNKLHSTGVQVDIDLPQIAVIGSQSAGKSSLIESISGITLPRAAGTCTRCPTECRLSRSDGKWKCVVSLRRLTDETGQVLGQVRNETFGPIITNKKEVEERIRRAQRAILNPNKPTKHFLEGEDEDPAEPELSFSTNCVSLQISGPDVADLSFCDLPGLIASVSRGGNEGDIKLVESLVTSYIKKPSCIILLTVACETDFENQGAHRLAKSYDPEGKRTIGVLTKPDRIPSGEESRWLPFIRNEKEPLENNWYCVKQPNSVDLKQGVTWAQARAREDEFFSITAPWSELEGIYQKYLRTTNLVDRLSSILSDLISKRLPQIQDELEKSIYKTREALAQLPKEPSEDALTEVSTRLHIFANDLERLVEGVADKDGLLQLIRPAQARFINDIRMTTPSFRPFERKSGPKSLPQAKFLLDEEGDEDEDSSGDQEFCSVFEDNNVSIVGLKRKRGSAIVYIDDVLERAHQARTRELPGNYPFVVQKVFIDTFISEWRVPALVLCKTIHATLLDHIKQLISVHFSSFGQGGLEHHIRILLQDHIKNCLERAEERVSWLLLVEDRPFSLNDHYLSSYRSKFFSHYKDAREKYRNANLVQAISAYTPPTPNSGFQKGSVTPTPQTGITKVMSGLAEMGLSGITPEDIPKLLPPDRMEPALNIMADVKAYFQVAYKRFSDNVPLAIDYELVRGVQRDVLKVLNSGLGIHGPDGHRICKEMVMESPHVADRRQELLKKLERLSVASSQLLQISL